MPTGLDPISRVRDIPERLIGEYTSIADAVAKIGASLAILAITADTTVSTALVIPTTLILKFYNKAKLTKSGSGTITFQGFGIADAKSQIPIFSGFAVGDITFTGTDYPKEVSLELWDTANTSLSDRLERACAAFNNGSKAVTFIAYPRVITKSVEQFSRQSLHFTVGEYTSTATGWPASYPPFLFNSHCTYTAEPGAIIYESDSPGNAQLFGAKMMFVAGSDGTVENVQFRDLHIKGHASQTHNGQSSTILLGNLKNGTVENVFLENTHAYGVLVGGFSTAGNYAENVDVLNFRSIGVGTQILAMINGKNITYNGFNIDVRSHNATGSFACVDIEPNTTDNRCENISVINGHIDARTTIAGIVINGVTMQAANAPVMLNPIVRNIEILGKDISTSGASAGQVSGAVTVYGAQGGVIADIYTLGSTQEAIFAQNCRDTRFRNIDVLQNNSAGGSAVKFEGCAGMRVDGILIDKTYTPFTQLANIVESESIYRVTSSGSTITETNPGGNPRFYSHLVNLTITLNNTDYIINTVNPVTYSLTTTVAVGTLAAKTFVDANVNTGTENIAITAHGHNTGSRVWLSSTGTVPAGLTAGRVYFVIRVDADNLKLADTLALALAGTPVNITAAAGGGTHTLTPVLITKFSSNQYRGNKALEGITLEPTGTSVVYSRWDEKLSDFVPGNNAFTLAKLASQSTNTLLGTLTEVPVDPVTWQNMVGVTQSGVDNKLTKTTPAGWDAGASSVQTIPANGNLQFTCTETATDRMCGLSDVDTNQHYNTIDFAIQTDASLNISIYESGTGIGSFGTATANTTKFKIERIGTEVKYYKDTTGVGGWTLMHTSTVSSSGLLRADTSIYTTGGTVGGVKLGGPFGNVEALARASAHTVLGIISATATLNFDLTAVVSQDLTITLTGAAVGDSVILGIPDGSVSADIGFTGWVSAVDTVKIRAFRLAGTPDPASGTFKATIIKA